MNRVVRLTVGAVSALALTGAGIAPAMASDGGYDDNEVRDPKIKIVKVRASKYDVDVKVRYRCDTEQDDHGDWKSDDDDDEYEKGKIWVSFEQKKAEYDGYKRVLCDGEWHRTWIDLDGDGKIKPKDATVEAKIRDPQHEYDTDEVDVEFDHHD